MGRAGLLAVAATFPHFIYTDFVASLIRAWFPGDAVFWTRSPAWR